jgi:hypothetical protein
MNWKYMEVAAAYYNVEEKQQLHCTVQIISNFLQKKNSNHAAAHVRYWLKQKRRNAEHKVYDGILRPKIWTLKLKNFLSYVGELRNNGFLFLTRCCE